MEQVKVPVEEFNDFTRALAEEFDASKCHKAGRVTNARGEVLLVDLAEYNRGSVSPDDLRKDAPPSRQAFIKPYLAYQKVVIERVLAARGNKKGAELELGEPAGAKPATLVGESSESEDVTGEPSFDDAQGAGTGLEEPTFGDAQNTGEQPQEA